ncbi:MAG: YbfB/YjiJ family MFS transporter [Gammaproteobacteria bacterium]|nr:YbfB/YjiJ family MFS transporter [Gammaproteobacteria bacterium]
MKRAAPSPLAATLAGGLLLVSTMGIGRFAYTPLLPRLRDALGWSLAQAGTWPAPTLWVICWARCSRGVWPAGPSAQAGCSPRWSSVC